MFGFLFQRVLSERGLVLGGFVLEGFCPYTKKVMYVVFFYSKCYQQCDLCYYEWFTQTNAMTDLDGVFVYFSPYIFNANLVYYLTLD